MKGFYKPGTGKKIKYQKSVSTNTKIYGDGCFVEKRKGTYILSFMTGANPEKSMDIKIEKEEFEAIKNKKISFEELFMNYGMYR